MENRVITLTSDFGLRDPYVAMVKGEILNINPAVNLVDLSHGIEPGDLIQAAMVMDMAARHFPSGTIHLCAVDPGVGTARKPILVITDDHYFVGPDNGVFTLICQREYLLFKVIELSERHFFRAPVSSVFHARDVFGPVAAWLSKGIDSSRFGKELKEFVRLPIPASSAGDGKASGVIIYADRFGNCATNITAEQIAALRGEKDNAGCRISVAGKSIQGLLSCFAEGTPGQPGALINSTGRLEVFINKGSAQKGIGLKPGVPVEVSWA